LLGGSVPQWLYAIEPPMQKTHIGYALLVQALVLEVLNIKSIFLNEAPIAYLLTF
jgi:hypothetical protein